MRIQTPEPIIEWVVTNDALWACELDCGRMGTAYSSFVLPKTTMEKVFAFGPEVTLYEVLGKHSEITFEVSRENTRMVTDDPTEVANARPSGNFSLVAHLMDRLPEELWDQGREEEAREVESWFANDC